MAVYTEVPDEALEAFIAGYDLGRLKSYKGIAEGVENTNYVVTTDGGMFILTLYEKRVAGADLPFFLGLMEHLAGAGIDCPTPVRDRGGAVLRQLAGRPAALSTFLDGVSVRRPRVAHCAAVGEALAGLHLAGRGYALRRQNALALQGWRTIAAKLGADAEQVAPGLALMIADEIRFLGAHWPAALPAGVIHADLFPNNVFFLGDRLSGLIDFYFACDDFLAYDLAVCLVAWCFETDHAFNVTKARALLRAYRRARPLEADEIAALPILARGAALRFLLTRAHDWLHTDATAYVRRLEPAEYVRKLGFFQRIERANEMGLDVGPP